MGLMVDELSLLKYVLLKSDALNPNYKLAELYTLPLLCLSASLVVTASISIQPATSSCMQSSLLSVVAILSSL